MAHGAFYALRKELALRLSYFDWVGSHIRPVQSDANYNGIGGVFR